MPDLPSDYVVSVATTANLSNAPERLRADDLLAVAVVANLSTWLDVPPSRPSDSRQRQAEEAWRQ